MSDPTFTPEADRELLVVYPDLSRAEAARDALIEAGVAPDDIHIGDEPDTIASLRAQMREELARPWFVPHAGVTHPRERGVVMVSAVGVAIALLAAFPIALIEFGSTTYWTRWFVVAVIASLFATTVALFAGAAAAPNAESEAPDAVRGTLLRVCPRQRGPPARPDRPRADPARRDHPRRRPHQHGHAPGRTPAAFVS